MAQWTDEGILIGRHKHGESSLILTIFTKEHGVAAGIVRANKSARTAQSYELGTVVSVKWNARLEEHLGRFTLETLDNIPAKYFHDYRRLLAISSGCELIRSLMPERQAHEALYTQFAAFLETLYDAHWLGHYVRFEAALLAEMGYGLDWTQCAVTGQKGTADLKFVSPKTGRAVSVTGAGEYVDRLLPLPSFLLMAGAANDEQLTEGLHLTGFFLERHAFPAHNKRMPAQRQRLVDAVGSH